MNKERVKYLHGKWTNYWDAFNHTIYKASDAWNFISNYFRKNKCEVKIVEITSWTFCYWTCKFVIKSYLQNFTLSLRHCDEVQRKWLFFLKASRCISKTNFVFKEIVKVLNDLPIGIFKFIWKKLVNRQLFLQMLLIILQPNYATFFQVFYKW